MKLGIAGGGTGGHLFPGLAVAECARECEPPHEVVFFGAQRGIESRAVPKAGFELLAEPVEGMVGRSPAAGVKAVAKMLAATLRVRRHCRERGIDVMMGLGGYASAPGVLAAWSCGIPVVLLEQNRIPGLSNRVLGRLATAVCTSFESGDEAFDTAKLRFTGNPLRAGLDCPPAQAARDTLLVFGGSGGARSVNRSVPAALASLAQTVALPPVLHQAGAAAVAEVEAAYAAAGIEAEVLPFIDDMASAYARARLAVCRAGASSVAELIATATPALLIPLAHSAADHQLVNARELEKSGAARVIVDDADCVKNLHAALAGLLDDEAELSSMSSRAAALGRPGAAARVLAVVEAAAAGGARAAAAHA